jgi:hypothetical protein
MTVGKDDRRAGEKRRQGLLVEGSRAEQGMFSLVVFNKETFLWNTQAVI